MVAGTDVGLELMPGLDVSVSSDDDCALAPDPRP